MLVAVGIYVTHLTGDPSDVGLVLGAYSLPVVVFVLLGGVLADRLPRQQVMIASDVVRAAAAADAGRRVGRGALAAGAQRLRARAAGRAHLPRDGRRRRRAGAVLGVVSTALAQRIPPHLLSRVSAWDDMGSLALVPIGYLLAGPVAEAYGAVEVMAVGGALGSAIMLLALVPRSTRQLERYDAPSAPAGLGAAAVMIGAP